MTLVKGRGGVRRLFAGCWGGESDWDRFAVADGSTSLGKGSEAGQNPETPTPRQEAEASEK
ncbi:MAG: hypothetical protein SNJ82_04080 [Gemmataceae bacterium]